jgi:predicted NAD/FAD-dependent oxidoreductase
MQDILIMGAGVAGLTLASELQKQGKDVLVLEKSRGLGGRSATRMINGSRLDHGAQYFTARDARFQKQVDGWLQQGHVNVWSHGFHRLTEKGLEAPAQGNPRYVFVNGMNTMGKLLAEGVTVRTQTKVTSVVKQGGGWLVRGEAGETFEAKTIILNMPAEQALALYPFEENIRQQLGGVVMEPCFALMLGYESTFAPDWQGVLIEVPSAISWVSHDSSKRVDPKETTLIVHSTPQFAREHFDEDPDKVKEQLLETFFALELSKTRNLKPVPLSWAYLHRWKYALASTHLDAPFIQQSETFYICGDWCGGARLESAYLSGLALAIHLS